MLGVDRRAFGLEPGRVRGRAGFVAAGFDGGLVRALVREDLIENVDGVDLDGLVGGGGEVRGRTSCRPRAGCYRVPAARLRWRRQGGQPSSDAGRRQTALSWQGRRPSDLNALDRRSARRDPFQPRRVAAALLTCVCQELTKRGRWSLRWSPSHAPLSRGLHRVGDNLPNRRGNRRLTSRNAPGRSRGRCWSRLSESNR